jgi:hypothetical protein
VGDARKRMKDHLLRLPQKDGSPKEEKKISRRKRTKALLKPP